MRFYKFTKFVGENLEDVVKYLKNLEADFRSLFVGLNKLNIKDNFDGFMWEGLIAASGTATITNPLGQIPQHRVILRVRPTGAGTVIITDSLNAWTSDLVYLSNVGTVDANIIVFFIR